MFVAIGKPGLTRHVTTPLGYVPETIDLQKEDTYSKIEDGSLFNSLVLAMKRGALVNCTRVGGKRHRARGTRGQLVQSTFCVLSSKFI